MGRQGYGFPTPLGPLRIRWSARGIRSVDLLQEACAGGEAPPWVQDAARLIVQYLEGQPADLASIPVDLEALPPFHGRVFEVLRRTQPGETLTYGHLATLAGSPGAARAVGQALKRNPLPILIPCHRVLAAGGLGGFSLLGGLETKRRLLALEGVHAS